MGLLWDTPIFQASQYAPTTTYAPEDARQFTSVDSRSYAIDYSYSPAVNINSAGATAAPVTKKDTQAAAQASATPTQSFQGGSPTATAPQGGTSGLSNTTLIVLGVAAVAAIFLLKM